MQKFLILASVLAVTGICITFIHAESPTAVPGPEIVPEWVRGIVVSWIDGNTTDLELIQSLKHLLEDNTAQHREITPANFVDPTKEPQHYINRYINEPEYKKWFDTYYSDLTIYEAVGVHDPLIRILHDENVKLRQELEDAKDGNVKLRQELEDAKGRNEQGTPDGNSEKPITDTTSLDDENQKSEEKNDVKPTSSEEMKFGEIWVKTDKDKYGLGDKIYISGQIPPFKPVYGLGGSILEERNHISLQLYRNTDRGSDKEFWIMRCDYYENYSNQECGTHRVIGILHEDWVFGDYTSSRRNNVLHDDGTFGIIIEVTNDYFAGEHYLTLDHYDILDPKRWTPTLSSSDVFIIG